jgi:hypothetical protein
MRKTLPLLKKKAATLIEPGQVVSLHGSSESVFWNFYHLFG